MNGVVKSAINPTASRPFDTIAKKAECARYSDEHLTTLLAEMPDQVAEASADVEEAKSNLEYALQKQHFLNKILVSRTSKGFQTSSTLTLAVQ